QRLHTREVASRGPAVLLFLVPTRACPFKSDSRADATDTRTPAFDKGPPIAPRCSPFMEYKLDLHEVSRLQESVLTIRSERRLFGRKDGRERRRFAEFT